MSRTPFDGLDELVNPLRHAQRLADEYNGMNYACTLAREAGMYGVRDLIAQHDFGLNARALAELDVTARYAREADAAAHFETIKEYALGLPDEAAIRSVAEQVRLAALALPQPDCLTENVLAEMQAIAIVQDHTPPTLAMETAAEHVRRQIEGSAYLSDPERFVLAHAAGSATLHEMNRLSAANQAMHEATALVSEWMQAPSLTSLIRDAIGVSSPSGLSAYEWAQLNDPYERMQALAVQLEPLGQIIDRYVHVDPIEDAVARLQRDWNDARNDLVCVDLDALQYLAPLDWLDGMVVDDDGSDDESAEVYDEAGVEASAEPASTIAPEVVPVFFVATRFLSGLALIRARTARLAARFDARVASAPDDFSDWLLVISGNQPAYAARIGTLSCRVLHGMWLWNAQLRRATGASAIGSEEQLTVVDAQEFDEAVVALVAVLEEIETSLEAA